MIACVEYLLHNKEEPMATILDPTTSTLKESFEDNVPQQWYRDYVENTGMEIFWKVRKTANYIGIEQLVLLVHVWLAFHIQDKSVDEMHDILGIARMSPEQEQEAREQHPWLFEILGDEEN